MAGRHGSRREAREKRRLDQLLEKGIGAIALGFAFVVASALVSNPALHTALSALRPLGWIAMLVGAALLGLGLIAKRQAVRAQASTSEAGIRPVRRPPPRPSSSAHARLADPADTASPRKSETALEIRGSSAAFPPPRPTEWGPALFDAIEWRRFEALVEALFAQAGFDTQSQSHGADEGIDIWLYSRSQPGAPVSLVQCKHWRGRQVGVDKVRELRGVMAAKNVARGQFATTSTFTPDAIAFAKDNGLNLLDVQALLALISRRTDEQRQALLNVALEGDYWRPTCVNCGTKMVARSPRKGGAAFWGCESYPRCKTTMPMPTTPQAPRK
jgi:restriction system protein